MRQAFSYAVDRERLATLGGDQNITAHGLYPPALPGYNAAMSGQTFDPTRARQLLAESSYGSADRLPPITFTSSGYGSSIRDSNAALADMWQQHLGVTIQFENLEPNRWSEALHDNKHGNLFSYGWCADYPDPENFADALFFSTAQENIGGYNNPELDQLLIKARSEPDVATRIALYQQAEQHITEQAAAIFLYHGTTQLLIQPRVEGFIITPISIPIERYISIRTP
jgi:oligopeptide transport system substrate-binding protein